MTDSDVLLRLQTSCATAHSHYDQVVAVSQKIINDSFDQLYEQFPDYGNVDFSSHRIGSIKGSLYSPRLLLGGGVGADLSLTSALYVMRFKDGNITIPADDDDDPDHVEPLAGWNLAVTIDLKTQSVVVEPDADPDEQARQQAIWDFIHDKFDIPGDYSIERLYAKLADAHWRDFDFANSQFGVNSDGSKRSWGQLIKQYPYLETDLQIMLNHWALDQEQKGLTTTGVKFNLPPPDKIDPLKPTFQPTAMIHQVYGYTNPAKGVPKPVISYEVPGDLNALLYCEMVSNHELPKDKQLASAGNFTTQASTIGGPRIDGTYTLSHQLFLESFLLPMLQAFNKTSIVYPTGGNFSYSGGTSTISWSYAIGNDQAHQDTNDQFFVFKPVIKSGTQSDPTAYQFTSEYTSTLSPHGHNPDYNVYGSYDATGTSQVDFKWTPGGQGFILSGLSVYKYDIEWADNDAMQRPFGWLRDKFEASWSMGINIDSVEGGVLKLSVNAGSKSDCNAMVTQTQHEQQQSYSPPNQAENIRDEIARQISTHVQTLETNLAEAFQTSAKFVYPGNGTFKFSAPCVGNMGEILATIEYQPLTSGKTSVPSPVTNKMRSMTQFGYSTVPVSAPGIAPETKLDWSYHKPLKGGQTAVEVLIQGKNTGAAPITLKGLSFTLSSEPEGRGLVTANKFKPDRWTLGSPDSTKSNIFQIVVDEDGTPAFANVKVVPGPMASDGSTPLTFSGTGEASVPSGGAITLALYTGTGVPNTYPVSITETWPPVDGSASHNLPQSVNVILSP
ncbi:hypothetical protein X797_008361 [Metarhizium robertsii]|uniref:Uncharacterized protein n=2 Tax=Metarhizium robertsii TaxID=568076 RepID=E9F7M5_METRA|nr:uncharacterized protein MAA_08274 [Metarhizium robertsii ARSEF 23]EFY96362.2 hypothetical protein MAA_08274 [Metarhizium robertsii ARSEF 23]EXU98647.1 hypothetical protein X797_008361 [Metarhizium robertsii]